MVVEVTLVMFNPDFVVVVWGEQWLEVGGEVLVVEATLVMLVVVVDFEVKDEILGPAPDAERLGLFNHCPPAPGEPREPGPDTR